MYICINYYQLSWKWNTRKNNQLLLKELCIAKMKWSEVLPVYLYLFIFRLSKVSSQNLEVINLDSWPWASSLTGFPPSLFDLGIPCIWVYTVLNTRNSSFERLWMQFHCAFFSVDKICKNRQIKSWKSAINKSVLQTAAVRQARSEAWGNKTAFPLKYLNFELCVHETIKTKHILAGARGTISPEPSAVTNGRYRLFRANIAKLSSELLSCQSKFNDSVDSDKLNTYVTIKHCLNKR